MLSLSASWPAPVGSLLTIRPVKPPPSCQPGLQAELEYLGDTVLPFCNPSRHDRGCCRAPAGKLQELGNPSTVAVAVAVHPAPAGKLKDLGNTVLGKFGLSLDNFKAEKDPDTGSYSIKFQQ